MKKFFAIYLSILCTFPILTNGNVPCSTYSSSDYSSGDRAGCLTHGGCQWFDFDSTCSPCPDDEYHPACSDPDSTDCQNACLNCIDSNNNWMVGAQTVSHSIFDINNTATGLSYCAWVCDNDWYKNDAGTGCVSCPDSTTAPAIYPDTNNIGDCSSCPSNLQLIHANNNKYYCGQCGAGTPTTQGGITTCSCLTGANHINGNMPPQGNIRVECLCSGTFVDGQCVCPLNKYLHQDNNGVYSCESCPDHSTSAQGSTDVNDCQCISNFPNRILDENGKLIGCSACANNAVFDNGLCKCNYGYYGNGTSSCTQCPTGMTTNNLGAIDIASCVMKSNTKFCTVSQNRTLCLNFIPAGTQINYPGTSH